MLCELKSTISKYKYRWNVMWENSVWNLEGNLHVAVSSDGCMRFLFAARVRERWHECERGN